MAERATTNYRPEVQASELIKNVLEGVRNGPGVTVSSELERQIQRRIVQLEQFCEQLQDLSQSIFKVDLNYLFEDHSFWTGVNTPADLLNGVKNNLGLAVAEFFLPGQEVPEKRLADVFRQIYASSSELSDLSRKQARESVKDPGENEKDLEKILATEELIRRKSEAISQKAAELLKTPDIALFEFPPSLSSQLGTELLRVVNTLNGYHQSVAENFEKNAVHLVQKLSPLLVPEDADFLNEYLHAVVLSSLPALKDPASITRAMTSLVEESLLKRTEFHLQQLLSHFILRAHPDQAVERQRSFGPVPQTPAPIRGQANDFYETGCEGVMWAAFVPEKIQDAQTRGVFFLERGDYIRISAASGSLLFEGFVDPDDHARWRPYIMNPRLGQPQAGSYNTHWIQAGIDPDRWASYFIECGNRIELWPAEKSKNT